MYRLTLLILCILSLSPATAEEIVIRERLEKPFAESREGLLMAIENRGLVISYISHIGDMLKRTGKDIGASKEIYEQAEIVEFCSARHSRQMMELDPHNIVFCPFSIAVYSLPGQSGSWLAYRRPSGSAASVLAQLLKEILADSRD